MKMELKDYYNYNKDGEVRAEIAFRQTDGAKESGIIPLGAFASILGVPLVESLRWKKSDFRGMILDARFVNDDSIKCDDKGNPLEDEDFEILPGKTYMQWEENLWVRRDGESALTWQEYTKLSAGEVDLYRRVNCIKVDVKSIFGLFHGAVQYYVCEEAVELLPEMLAKDVLTGDAITRRYLYECKRNLDFAKLYGYALNRALAELSKKAGYELKEWQRVLADVLAKHAGYNGELRSVTILPEIVDDHGNTVYGCDAVKIVEKWAELTKMAEKKSARASTKVTGKDLINEADEVADQGDNVTGH